MFRTMQLIVAVMTVMMFVSEAGLAQSNRLRSRCRVECIPSVVQREPEQDKSSSDTGATINRKELGVGSRIVVSANTPGFNDNESDSAHPKVSFVDEGVVGIITKMSPRTNRCCVRLESSPRESVWISLEYVRQRGTKGSE